MELAPPRGTEDLLPPASTRMAELYRRAHRTARLHGYRYVETPGFEHTELFARTSGETSDVVGKEMYTFLDRADRSLTLRPEGTAPVVRAYLRNANELGSPFKAYYVNEAWRYSKPQRGRLREFRIFGVEVLGVADPGADVEVIALAAAFFAEIGAAQFDLQVNSIGDATCRPAYRRTLIEYLEGQAPRLRDEHKDRFRDNPLRVLDCKDEACREVAADAPKITDHLCADCKAHFDAVQAGLSEEGVAFEVEPTLVRGLDYYTRTAFEFVHRGLSPSQSTICGGGRYDGLAEVLGGPPTPGVGFGLGLDRAAIALEEEGVELADDSAVVAFVVAFGEGAGEHARSLVRQLRAAGVPAETAFGERPLGSQMKMADRAGARFAVIIGEREAAAGEATVKLLADGSQQTVPLTDVPQWIAAQQEAS
ncbi:MAG TPA: histidine--tRNA ligase [Actinomycetota bacterium]|nr:histidine--tRNA ligase [Actinomycetota bacterium]